MKPSDKKNIILYNDYIDERTNKLLVKHILLSYRDMTEWRKKMGILTRFKDIMSANINSLLDKCEDPEKMIDQYMRNLQSDLGNVKAETAAVMAEEKRAKRELDECNAEIEKFQNYAVKAVEAGNDNDARQFLEKKNMEEEYM